ncbi:hypothetical protein AURDEDRAFT_164287 [Auricularia subglabra TFB-10046 SS5]|nr:hypothetical protein AURDEDRAFT_164287 [Auricularia subglabra TFB-10046 SS5]
MQSDAQLMMEDCNRLLDIFTDRITAYLRADDEHPRTWLPRTKSDATPRWTEIEATELRAMQIPALPVPEREPYEPDMLLYRLGQLESLDDEFSDRLADVTESEAHSLIVNTSGTGKTRLLFEVLSRSWGLFFTCRASYVTDPYGSSDLGAALTDLPSFDVDGRLLQHQLRLGGDDPRSAEEDLRHNCRIAHLLIYSVILARLLVFNRFCIIGASLGISDQVLRRRWLLLQLRPAELLQSDPFGLITGRLNFFCLEDVVSETKRALAAYGNRLEFVALDEAQAALSFSRSFALSDGRTNAPVLREIVHCFASVFQTQRFLVAGTDCDLRIVEDAVSGIPSPYAGFRHVYALGSFDSLARTTAYLRHFFRETFTDADCLEAHGLFRGR